MSPGGIRAAGGASYRYLVVQSEKEMNDHLAAGWFISEVEAISSAGDEAYLYGLNDEQYVRMQEVLAKKAKNKPKVEVAPVVEVEEEDDSPPTRSELEEKARELNIRFNARTPNETLIARIERAIRYGG